jgi:hypothetical protein
MVMTQYNIGRNTMSSNIETSDDLEVIRGIGPDAREWLGETFDVRTFTALADLSEEELISRIKADNKPWLRWARDWPAEAGIRAAKMRTEAEAQYLAPAPVAESAIPKPTYLQTEKTIPANRASMPNTGENHWQQVAYFNITFLEHHVKDRVVGRKTTINYHEADENAEWDGFETERISQWILEQAGDELSQEIQEVPATEPKPELLKEEKIPAQIAISVTGLRLYQPADAEISLTSGKNGRPHTGTIQSGLPFAAKAEFEIDEQAATTIANHEIPYRVQFYTQDRSSKEKAHLGDAKTGLLASNKTSYSAMLGGITLPSGTYRLRVVVIAESEEIVPGYLELPILRVV